MRQVAKYASPLIVILGLAVFPENLSRYILPIGLQLLSISAVFLACKPLREKANGHALLMFWLAPLALMWLLSERREGRAISPISIGFEVLVGGIGTALLLSTNNLKKHDLRLFLVIFLTWAVAYLSGSSGGADRMVPWFNFLGLSVDQLNFLFVIIRKTIHVSFYGSFTWLLMTYLWNDIQNRRVLIGFGVVFPLLMAIADEFRQSFMPNRQGSVTDVTLDLSATIVVLILLQLWERRNIRRNAPTT